MSNRSQGDDSFVAVAHAANGIVHVLVTPSCFKVVKRKGKFRTLLHCKLLKDAFGIHVKGEVLWIELHMIHTKDPEARRTRTQRRKESRRYGAAKRAVASNVGGPLAQGAERTERAPAPERTETTTDASQEATTAVTSVANVLECPQCKSEVNAPVGAEMAYCAECKSE